MKTQKEIEQNIEYWSRVKKLCKQKKLTQSELCNITGIDKGKLQGQITRNIAPSIFDAQKIALALSTSVEYLVNGSEVTTFSNRLNELLSDLSALIDRYKQ